MKEIKVDVVDNGNGTYSMSFVKNGYKFVFSNVIVSPIDIENIDEDEDIALSVMFDERNAAARQIKGGE